MYLLFGTDEQTGENVVYVGQADVRKNGNGLLGRLYEHKRNPDKDYWTEAVVFTSTNNFLGATEMSWLESYFCTLAIKTNRYVVKNGNEPSPGKPKEEIISDLDEFAEYSKTVMSILSFKIFDFKLPINLKENISKNNSQIFFCHRKDLEGKGMPTSDGFVIFARSRVSLTIAEYIPKGYMELRKKHEDLIDEKGILSEDVICPSPSAAAVFVIGKNANGLTEWKTADGETLKEIEASKSN